MILVATVSSRTSSNPSPSQGSNVMPDHQFCSSAIPAPWRPAIAWLDVFLGTLNSLMHTNARYSSFAPSAEFFSPTWP